MLDPMTVMTLADLVVADGDSYRGSREVGLRVVEDIDPFTAVARVLLEVDGRQRLAPTAEQWRIVARLALEAADMQDAAQASTVLTAA